MAVGGVPTSGAPQTAASTSETSRTRLADSFDMFLTLLTTQMKNQDPLSPMDSTQFTQQIVQMTGVEQQLQTNDLLKQLVTNTASGVQAAVSLIGKEVKVVSDEAALKNGSAKWSFKLDKAAADLKVEVLDSKGNVVANAAPTEKGAGEHTFTWNGKGSLGSTLPDGTYKLRITAKDGAGAEIGTTTYVQGLVTSVEQANGTTLLTVNGGKVRWDKVTTITQPPAPAPADSTTGQTAGGGSPSNPDDETSSPAAA
jgi:flagellar basal-body rod modification protein FlgD